MCSMGSLFHWKRCSQIQFITPSRAIQGFAQSHLFEVEQCPNITAPNGLYFIEDSEAWQAVSVGSMRNIESRAARARSTPSPSLPAPVAMSSLSRPRQASRRGSCHAVATVASSPNGRILHPPWAALDLIALASWHCRFAWTHTSMDGR